MEMFNEMRATIQAYRQVIGVLAMIFGPSLFGRVMRYIQARRNGHDHSHGPGGPHMATPGYPLSKGLLAIVVLHAAYTAFNFYVPPYDVFTTNHLKIRTPTEIVGPIVLRSAGITAEQIDDHPLIGLLLARLTSLESRYAYARWGHPTFLRCVWCRDQYDYTIASLPNILTPYAAQALLIGFMGWQTIGGAGATERKARYRSVAGWVLGGMLAADYAIRYMAEIRAGPDNDCLHLDSIIVTFRNIGLFLVTAAYALFPLPADARAAEVTSLRILESTLRTQRLASLARQAISRSPAMNRVATEMRDKRGRAEDAACADPQVIAVAQSIGIMEGNDYSRQAKENAHKWVTTHWDKNVRHR